MYAPSKFTRVLIKIVLMSDDTNTYRRNRKLIIIFNKNNEMYETNIPRTYMNFNDDISSQGCDKKK